MAKRTVLSVQNDLTRSVKGYHERAAKLKRAYQDLRRDILQSTRLTDEAKTHDLAELDTKTREQLAAVRAEQERYVEDLRHNVERELAGYQPSDANSVLLRRDAADRARKISDQREAREVLRDAIRNGDEAMAHAVGTRARSQVWTDVASEWRSAYPETAETAEALAFVEGYTSEGAYNLANQIAYSDASV